MEAGEKEMRKAFEEVTTRNVKAAIAHANETRRMINELTLKVDHLEKNILEKDKIINGLRMQISTIQQQLYSGGS